MPDPNAKPLNYEGRAQPSGSPRKSPKNSDAGNGGGGSHIPAPGPGDSDQSLGGDVGNTDAVPDGDGESSSASEQLAQLLGLHIPIPTYTPPEGPPEELEFKPGSKVDIEPFQRPQRSPAANNDQSLTEIYQKQEDQRPQKTAPEVEFRPPPPRPSPAPSPRPTSLPKVAAPQSKKDGLGDSVNMLQDILVRPELAEFRGRLDSLEGHTAELDSAQQSLGVEMGELRQYMEQAIAQVINQLVDERFAQLEIDWRSRIDSYFQQSFQGLFTEYFERHIEQQWPKLAGQLAQQLAGQMNRINGRLGLLESRLEEVSTTLQTTVRSLRDISPDFEAGVRMVEVEKKLKGLTQHLASLAGGLGTDTLETYADLRTMVAKDGTAANMPTSPKPSSPVETKVHLELVEQDLTQLGGDVEGLNQELGRHETPLPESMGVGSRLAAAEERLKQLTFALVAIVQLLQQRPDQWEQDSNWSDRLKNLEQDLGALSNQVTQLSLNLPEAVDEPEMVSSSLSIRVKGVDPQWNSPEQWDDEKDEDWEVGAEEALG